MVLLPATRLALILHCTTLLFFAGVQPSTAKLDGQAGGGDLRRFRGWRRGWPKHVRRGGGLPLILSVSGLANL